MSWGCPYAAVFDRSIWRDRVEKFTNSYVLPDRVDGFEIPSSLLWLLNYPGDPSPAPSCNRPQIEMMSGNIKIGWSNVCWEGFAAKHTWSRSSYLYRSRRRSNWERNILCFSTTHVAINICNCENSRRFAFWAPHTVHQGKSMKLYVQTLFKWPLRFLYANLTLQ